MERDDARAYSYFGRASDELFGARRAEAPVRVEVPASAPAGSSALRAPSPARALQRAEDFAQYARAPEGRYLADRTFVHWHVDEGLSGFALWGRPDAASIDALLRCMELDLRPGRRAYRSVLDLRGLEGVDPVAFERFSAFVAQHRERYGAALERQALLRPGGLAGAVVAGFYHLVPPRFAYRFCEGVDEVVAWLELGDRLGALDAVAAVLDDVRGRSAFSLRVRSALRARLQDPDLAAVASSLSTSVRTLQRRLQDEGSTFQRELNAARVEVARELLRDTDVKLTAVAREVGCQSYHRFCAMFRAHTGDAPLVFRQRHRAASAHAGR